MLSAGRRKACTCRTVKVSSLRSMSFWLATSGHVHGKIVFLSGRLVPAHLQANTQQPNPSKKRKLAKDQSKPTQPKTPNTINPITQKAIETPKQHATQTLGSHIWSLSVTRRLKTVSPQSPSPSPPPTHPPPTHTPTSACFVWGCKTCRVVAKKSWGVAKTSCGCNTDGRDCKHHRIAMPSLRVANTSCFMDFFSGRKS